MQHVGVCSVLIACCLTAPAWAVRFGEQEPADGVPPVSLPAGQVPVVQDENYAPWQVYGYGSPYDQSAIAGYTGWPQVCSDGLWDNFCNEQHCHCYQGPQQHYRHGNRFAGGCNNCGPANLHGHRGKRFVGTYSTGGNCAGDDRAMPTDLPALELQSNPESTLQSPPVPEPPATENSSTRLLPRSNPIRQPLLPTLWKSGK